jgi:hypothetical protein
MDADLMGLFVAGLTVVAGIVGFVVGGTIAIRCHTVEHEARMRELDKTDIKH